MCCTCRTWDRRDRSLGAVVSSGTDEDSCSRLVGLISWGAVITSRTDSVCTCKARVAAYLAEGTGLALIGTLEALASRKGPRGTLRRSSRVRAGGAVVALGTEMGCIVGCTNAARETRGARQALRSAGDPVKAP